MNNVCNRVDGLCDVTNHLLGNSLDDLLVVLLGEPEVAHELGVNLCCEVVECADRMSEGTILNNTIQDTTLILFLSNH
jgi:hypothetical protein